MPEHVWIEMMPLLDNVIFHDQDQPHFNRVKSWEEALGKTHDLPAAAVRVEIEDGLVKWSVRQERHAKDDPFAGPFPAKDYTARITR